MWSSNAVCLFSFSLCFSLSYASIFKLNDTTLSQLPPLYGLDSWSQCQRPGDQYCSVDADLSSDTPSKLMDIIQAYSNQTVKHYNRSHIHRGVCVTRCRGRQGTLLEDVQDCLNQTIYDEYGLQVSVQSVRWCSEHGAEEQPSAGSRGLAVLTLVLVVFVAVATILHVLGDHCAKIDGITTNRFLLVFSLKRNWEILTYDRSQPRQDDRMSSVACIEGIRVLAIHCVILSHVMFMNIYSFSNNPQYVEKMYDKFGWQALFNSPIWLQAFFAISAFLTTYTILIYTERKPFTLLGLVNALATRWVRLTPAAVYSLWFTMYWFPLLGSGPQWGWLVRREAEDCAQRWYHHLFYAHNHLPLGKFCMGHTWYLAVDMQLHLLGLILLFLFLRYRVPVLPVLLGLMFVAAGAAGVVTYIFDLSPIITAQSPEALRTLFAGSTVMSQLYLPVYMNLAGYVVGMSVAFILYNNLKNGVDLTVNKAFNLIYHLSLTLASLVVLAGTVFLWDAPPDRALRVLYTSLDRVLVAACFGVFLLGCVSKCKSVLRQMFSWRGFHLLGRLSYCAFLVHFIVLRLTLGSDPRLHHTSLIACITLFISTSVLTYLASIPFCLLVELPFTQLWKNLVDGDPQRPAPVAPAPPPEVSAKTFDLVTNVHRPVVKVE